VLVLDELEPFGCHVETVVSAPPTENAGYDSTTTHVLYEDLYLPVV
jgi:hypothetical protein